MIGLGLGGFWSELAIQTGLHLFCLQPIRTNQFKTKLTNLIGFAPMHLHLLKNQKNAKYENPTTTLNAKTCQLPIK